MEARDALYIPTYEYNYKVITRCDTILQEYYITNRRNWENIKRCASMNSTKGRSRVAGDAASQPGGARKGLELQLVCLLRKVNLVLNKKNPRQSKLRDLDMRIQGSQNSPASGDANTKWHTWISTCVSINPKRKHEF